MGRCLSIAILLWTIAASASAREIDATPENVRRQIATLLPGDTLTLAPGRYSGGLWLKGLHGRPDAPITIRGKARKRAPRQGRHEYYRRDRLPVVGDPRPDVRRAGPTGRCHQGRQRHQPLLPPCHHREQHNRQPRANQQIVGISTKTPCADWTIRGNTIRGAGTGLYLGNSDGNRPFVRGVIEYNYVSDPVGYCMQIKRQNVRPDIAGLPKEPSSTIIRYNIFVKGDKPSPDGNRPNMLLGGWPDDGPGSQDRYQVYGNAFFHGPQREPRPGDRPRLVSRQHLCRCGRHGALISAAREQIAQQIFVYRNTFVQVGRAISFRATAGRVRGRR